MSGQPGWVFARPRGHFSYLFVNLPYTEFLLAVSVLIQSWSDLCSHQQQTRSVPLDWVFVVPTSTLVAVRTLEMKDHHCPSFSQHHHSIDEEYYVWFLKRIPMFSNILTTMSKFYWAIPLQRKDMIEKLVFFPQGIFFKDTHCRVEEGGVNLGQLRWI